MAEEKATTKLAAKIEKKLTRALETCADVTELLANLGLGEIQQEAKRIKNGEGSATAFRDLTTGTRNIAWTAKELRGDHEREDEEIGSVIVAESFEERIVRRAAQRGITDLFGKDVPAMPGEGGNGGFQEKVAKVLEARNGNGKKKGGNGRRRGKREAEPPPDTSGDAGANITPET